jgi:hypothetical protein
MVTSLWCIYVCEIWRFLLLHRCNLLILLRHFSIARAPYGERAEKRLSILISVSSRSILLQVQTNEGFKVRLNRSREVVLLCSLFGMLISSVALAADPAPAVQSEVAHLFNYIENSGCQFYRNGSWHDARRARAHLEMKYRYLCRKGQVSGAEDVIERAGSKSSVSGKPYQIRCGDNEPVLSGDWLRTELQRFRTAGKK